MWNEFLNTFKNSHIIKEQYKNDLLPIKMKEREQPQISINEIKNKIEKLDIKIINLNNNKTDCYKKRCLVEISVETYDDIILDIDKSINNCNLNIEELNSEIIKIESGINWYDWVSDFENIYSEMKSIKSIEDKRKYIKKYVDKVIVTYCFVTKTHSIKILFKVKIVNDSRRRLEKYRFKVSKGKNDKVIPNINSNRLIKSYNNHLSTQTLTQNYSTVTDLARFLG